MAAVWALDLPDAGASARHQPCARDLRVTPSAARRAKDSRREKRSPDGARSDADSHHGLGLAIVAAIARMHGGRPVAHSDGGITTIGLILGAPRSAPVTGAPSPPGVQGRSGTELNART